MDTWVCSPMLDLDILLKRCPSETIGKSFRVFSHERKKERKKKKVATQVAEKAKSRIRTPERRTFSRWFSVERIKLSAASVSKGQRATLGRRDRLVKTRPSSRFSTSSRRALRTRIPYPRCRVVLLFSLSLLLLTQHRNASFRAICGSKLPNLRRESRSPWVSH